LKGSLTLVEKHVQNRVFSLISMVVTTKKRLGNV